MNLESPSALLTRLHTLLGEDGIDIRPEELAFFSLDALGSRGGLTEAAVPLAILRPSTAEATAAVLAVCRESRLSVVPYGAGTGLMGGARSKGPGVVLDTSRLNDLSVQAEDNLIWAGAGAILADVDNALQPHGLCLGHDPWTFPVASIAGPISTNGLGYMGGRYGGIGEQVMALEVALADGSLIRTRAVRRRSTGPELWRLFIGAEGTLGVITAAALRAFAIPEARELRGIRFPRFEDGFQAIAEINRLGMRPSLLDYGEGHTPPWPEMAGREQYPPTLYLGFEGFAEEVEASLARASTIINRNLGEVLPQEQVEQFWRDRHVIAERFARSRRQERRQNRNPGFATDFMHVALPPSQTLPFRESCLQAAAQEGVAVLECGLWLGPELFSASFATPTRDDGPERLERFMNNRLAEVQDRGGSMEYVHGAGVRLAHLMEREHGASYEVLRTLKRALDPERILNPGTLGL